MPQLAFLVPSAAGEPEARLATALCEEVSHQDAAAVLCAEAPEPQPDRVYVALAGSEPESPAVPLSHTILVVSASPGTQPFAASAELARRAGAVFHVNLAAAERLREMGVPARHLQLGYSGRWPGGEGAGDGDSLALVADCGGYFDWVRALTAIHDGAAVLHERSLGMAPLVAGRHLFVAAPAALDVVAEALRRDSQRLASVRGEALGFLRAALPLELAAGALIGAARALVAQPLPVGVTATPGQHTDRSK